jgi:hypothetical protein
VTAKNPDSERFKQARIFGLLSSIPGFLVVPPVVGALAGLWLDKRFDTAPGSCSCASSSASAPGSG